MKKQTLKKVFAFAMACIVGGLSLFGTPANVSAAVVTDEQIAEVKEFNQAYRDILNEELGWGNRTSVKFDLVDMDDDGYDDLVVSYTLNTDNISATYAYSAEKDKWTGEEQRLFFVEGPDGSRAFMYEEYVEPIDGTAPYYCYELWEPFGQYGILSGYSQVIIKDAATGVCKYFGEEEPFDEELQMAFDDLLASATEVSGKYDATTENMDKYLPVDDITIRAMLGGTITLPEITLEVGENFHLSHDVIDQMISPAVVELNKNLVARDYDGEDLELDRTYLEEALYYEKFYVDTYEIIEKGIWTKTESNETYEKWIAGENTLNGREFSFVEEGEAVFFKYVQAKKTGSATITIPNYKIGDVTAVVNIPVKIVDKPTSITSKDDATITIKDESGVLPAKTTMTTAKVESGTVYETAVNIVKENVSKTATVAVFELNLVDGNNIELHQLDGKVKVTMDVPFTLKTGSTLKVYRVDGDKLVECTTTVADGKVTFETDHFSTYVFVEISNVPDTGDNTNVGLFAMTFLFGAGVLVVSFKGKKRA